MLGLQNLITVLSHLLHLLMHGAVTNEVPFSERKKNEYEQYAN